MKKLWKVCGMRDLQNIEEVLTLSPDFLGFIFYPQSPRFVGEDLHLAQIRWPGKTQKVGVFVDQEMDFVLHKVATCGLDAVQLHGEEAPEYCETMRQEGILVFKAFGVDEAFRFESIKKYEQAVDYFLFDTKATGAYGGHGGAFDWNLLQAYSGDTPFLLAGGISLENISEVMAIEHPRMAGIDVNSRFEISPGLKDMAMLKALKAELV